MAGGQVNYKVGADVANFKQGMNEAQASLRTLDAALKNNEASFKAGGDAQVYMQQKSQLLTDKMNKQKTLVTQLQTQLQKMKDNGIKPTSVEYQNLQTKLLNAQTAMNETKVSLDNLDGSQQQAATSAGKLVDSVNGISKKMSLEQVISGIGSITSAMETAASKAVNLGETIWNNVMNSAQWADDTQTMALMYGIDLDTFLRVQKLVDSGMDTSVDAILKAQTKLRKNVGAGSDSFTKVLEELGLLTQGKFGATASAMDPDELFWKAGQAIMGLTNAFDQEEKAQAIFGKSWRELVPLFSQFGSQEEYNKALESMQVNTKEEVDALATLQDQVDELHANMQTLQNKGWAALAPGLTSAAEALNGLLESVLEYLNTPEGKQALKDMADSVSALFEDLGKIDPESVVQNFTNVFNTLVDGFVWVKENKDGVIDALKVIVAGWAGLKLTGGALEVAKLISGVTGLVGGKAAAEAAGAAAGAGWGGAFAKAVLAAAPWLAGLITLLNPSEGGDSVGNNTIIDANGNITKEGETIGVTVDKNGNISGGNGFGPMVISVEDIVPADKKTKSPWVIDLTWANIAGSLEEAFTPKNASDSGILGKPGDLIDSWNQWFGGSDSKVEIPTEPDVPANAAEDIANQIGTVTVPIRFGTRDIWASLTGGGGGGGGGSHNGVLMMHANGIWSVPFDNYPALLHRGERVVPAREVSSRSFNSNLYVEKMVMNNGTDAQGLASAMAAANRRRMSGYGS